MNRDEWLASAAEHLDKAYVPPNPAVNTTPYAELCMAVGDILRALKAEELPPVVTGVIEAALHQEELWKAAHEDDGAP